MLVFHSLSGISHQKQFPKPSGILKREKYCSGRENSASPGPRLLLFSGIITSDHPGRAERGRGDPALHGVTVKEGELSLDDWDILESCLRAAHVPCSQIPGCFTPLQPELQQGTCRFFRRLLGRVTEQGCDVSSRGTRSSSPQILPPQISVSGWRRSGANNDSMALRGVRSAEESTST